MNNFNQFVKKQKMEKIINLLSSFKPSKQRVNLLSFWLFLILAISSLYYAIQTEPIVVNSCGRIVNIEEKYDSTLALNDRKSYLISYMKLSNIIEHVSVSEEDYRIYMKLTKSNTLSNVEYCQFIDTKMPPLCVISIILTVIFTIISIVYLVRYNK
jgi:disulfide bond formation protein DsbB